MISPEIFEKFVGNFLYYLFNNYSPNAKLILLNNPRTEPEVNNCFSIFTRSDLNRIRKETIRKRLV